MKNKPGMTILEILIVLLIFGVIMSLGFQSIMEYRKSVEFQSANQEFLSLVQTVENMARNNVISPTSNQTDLFANQLDGYLIKFNYRSSSPLNIYMCSFDNFNRLYSCLPSSVQIKNYPNIEIDDDNQNYCDGIYFKNLTTDIKLLNYNSLGNISTISEEYIDEGLCRIYMLNSDNADKYTQEYYFDSVVNNYVKI